MQETLDFVYAKLKEQGCKSVNPATGLCAYRGKFGIKCAIGWLIPDEKYNMEMENVSARVLVSRFPELKPILGGFDPWMLKQIQEELHDDLDDQLSGLDAAYEALCKRF